MHSRRLGFISCAALVVLALTGCGGGETTTNGTPGDESGMSLLEKWRGFADGNPTLSMTGEEIEEAWTAAAEGTTHYVFFWDTGNRALPQPDREPPFERPPDEGIVPSILSIELLKHLEVARTDIEFMFAPVMEHNGIPVAEIKHRSTYVDYGRPTILSDVLSYGGWLEYTTFRVDLDRECEVGAVGCSGTSPDYLDAHIHSTMAGRYSESTPTGVGSATWAGVMVGMESPAYPAGLTLDHDWALHWPTPGSQPNAYLGDARIVIDDLAVPDVDVSFTNIHNVTEGTKHRDLDWENLRVEDGVFGSRFDSPDEYYLQREFILGMFNGPRHQEVGGEFLGGGIKGVFGAKRQ